VDLVDAHATAVAQAMIERDLILGAEREWLTLCAAEALINAMVHGNEADPELAVEVALEADAARWRLRIHDQGDGFSLAAIPSSDDTGAFVREHGRGIRLLRSWLDRLAYFDRGATAVLERARGRG
jgi:anti-sigma regulatory factor (Ser/Thr protein kinase)